MPVRVGWYIRDYIFIIQAEGTATDQEYIELGNSPIIIGAMNHSRAPLIHYFFEILDPKTTLPSIRVRGQIQIEKHPKDGWSMLIGFKHNIVWRMTATIIAQVSRSRFVLVDNREAAFDFLRRIDATLPTQPDASIEWIYELNWNASNQEVF